MSKIAFLRAPKGPPTGLRGFMLWLRAKQPNIFHAAREKIAGSHVLGDLGLDVPEAAPATPVTPSVADKIKDIVMGVSTAYLTAQQLRAQNKLLDAQLKRAQAGQAPLDLDLASYGFTGPSVNVGLSGDTKSLLVWGAVGAVALYLLMRK